MIFVLLSLHSHLICKLSAWVILFIYCNWILKLPFMTLNFFINLILEGWKLSYAFQVGEDVHTHTSRAAIASVDYYYVLLFVYIFICSRWIRPCCVWCYRFRALYSVALRIRHHCSAAVINLRVRPVGYVIALLSRENVFVIQCLHYYWLHFIKSQKSCSQCHNVFLEFLCFQFCMVALRHFIFPLVSGGQSLSGECRRHHRSVSLVHVFSMCAHLCPVVVVCSQFIV